MKHLSLMALTFLALCSVSSACLRPKPVPVPLPLTAPVVKGPVVQTWVIVYRGKTFSTQVHAEAHKFYADHPGSHVWQLTVPASPTFAAGTTDGGTALFGIVLCK